MVYTNLLYYCMYVYVYDIVKYIFWKLLYLLLVKK